MEPDISVELITKNKMLVEEGVTVAVLIGNHDDLSTAAVRHKASHQIEKWSDVNHMKRSLNSALCALKLPNEIINYFVRLFTPAFEENKEDALAAKNAHTHVVNHAFGDHKNCENCCLPHIDGNNYVHEGLPNGKLLTDPKLRGSLTNLFLKYANSATKLAPCGSLKANESSNNIVCSKHSKSRCYVGSDSFAYGAAAGLCQKKSPHRICR